MPHTPEVKTETKALTPVPMVRPEPIPHPDINEFKLATAARNTWLQKIPAHHTVEVILSPSYWAHHAYRMNEWDEILCCWEDKSRRAVLLVLKATPASAHVKLLTQDDLRDANDAINVAEEIDKYHVTQNGIGTKWRIIRKGDNYLVRDGFDSDTAAIRWLTTEHLFVPSKAA